MSSKFSHTSLPMRLAAGRRGCAIALSTFAFSSFLALGALTCAADDRKDAATQQAVDIAVEAFAPALAAVGVPISGEEKQLLKGVMACALNGGSLDSCGRSALVQQVPKEARPLTDCMLQGGNLPQCAQQEIVVQLPPEVEPIANCLMGGNINAASVKNCVQAAVVAQVPGEVRLAADCLLNGRPAAECASTGIISQMTPEAQLVARCLIEKQSIPQCASAGLSSLPPQLQSNLGCLADRATAQACLQKQIILGLQPAQQDLARCMTDPSAAPACAQAQLGKELYPGLTQAVQCITQNPNPATCGGRVTVGGKLGDALETLDKLKGDIKVNPGQAPSSLQNILAVAKGIRDDDWGSVLTYGGAEVYKAAAKIVLDVVLPTVLPGVGALVAYAAGPIIDTVVQNRVDLMVRLTKAIKAHDEAAAAEVIAEFYMLLQIVVTLAGGSKPAELRFTGG